MKRILIALLLASAMPAAAQAVLIDFEELTSGLQGVGFLAYPDATFTSSTGMVYIKGAGASNDFVAFDPINSDGSGITTVDFTAPVSNLTFGSAGDDGTGVLSSADVFVDGIFSATVAISYDGVFVSYDPVDLTGFSNVTKLVLSSTDLAGVSWDNFSFVVPEPSSAALLALGLVGIAAGRRRAR